MHRQLNLRSAATAAAAAKATREGRRRYQIITLQPLRGMADRASERRHRGVGQNDDVTTATSPVDRRPASRRIDLVLCRLPFLPLQLPAECSKSALRLSTTSDVAACTRKHSEDRDVPSHSARGGELSPVYIYIYIYIYISRRRDSRPGLAASPSTM